MDSFGIYLRRRGGELCEIVTKAFHKRDLAKKQIVKKKCGGNKFMALS